MIAAEILHRQYTTRAQWGDFAVLYRGNHQSRVLEQALREQRIPYHLSGGTSFFERTEIKDLMCYLRLAINPDDNTAFLRIVNTPRRDIGVTSAGIIAQFAGSTSTSACSRRPRKPGVHAAFETPQRRKPAPVLPDDQ